MIVICSVIFCRTCWRDSILLWSMNKGLNKDHSILTVKLVTGLDEWTWSTSRSQICSKSFSLSSTRKKPRANTKQTSDFFPFRYLAGWCLSFITKPCSLGTLHFTSAAKILWSCSRSEAVSFHFQTLISNISDRSSGHHLYFTSDVLQVLRFNQSMLHRPPSHLLKRLCCWSQRKVQAAWASETDWRCVSCWDLCHGPPILSIM